MGKEMFGHIEIEKHKFYQHKGLIKICEPNFIENNKRPFNIKLLLQLNLTAKK